MKREEDRVTDEQLKKYVSLDNLESFLLMAGAGSGKTRSLVNILEYLRDEWGRNLKITGRKIAVITFTKAASEEIQTRISYDSSFHISTIHSFAWELIKPFQADIKEYLIKYYEDKLSEEKEKRGSTEEKIKTYEIKLKNIKEAIKFNYSPDTNITAQGSLNHSEVINIMTYLLVSHNSFRKILVQKYPVLLIDECQDTDRKLLTTFIEVEKDYTNFCLGLIGDMMQRVYMGGLTNLLENVEHWGRTPQKEMNWRSQKRIVEFLNTLRKQTDKLEQVQNKDKNGGVVKVYLIKEHEDDNQNMVLEKKVEEHFKNFTENNSKIITLILEHRMAAIRNGFSNMFNALSEHETRDALNDATGKEMNFIKRFLLPFSNALQSQTEFEILRLFRKEKIFKHFYDDNKNEKIDELKEKIDEYKKVIDKKTKLRDMVEFIDELNITELPNAFLIRDDSSQKSKNWQKALDEPLEEFENYFKYKDEQSPYITQQGSKGLEYDNIVVIMNDKEAKGTTFNFGKVMGIIEPTKTDLRNSREGKDNSIERTKRLLYVAASRARENLALVIYTSDINETTRYFLDYNLVTSDEIIIEGNL